MSLKMTNFILQPHLPGANELKQGSPIPKILVVGIHDEMWYYTLQIIVLSPRSQQVKIHARNQGFSHMVYGWLVACC